MTNKEFVKDYVPWDALRKTLFNGLKFNEYDAITERFLRHFNHERPEQYVNGLAEMFTQSEGKFPDKIASDGEFKRGGGFHLSLAAHEYDIVCCICDCQQSVNVSTSTKIANTKCRGCKRKIQVLVSKEGVQVKER